MNRTTKTVTGIAALIGAMLVITTPTPASAIGSTRLDVCLAIDEEPLCDVVRSAQATTNGAAPLRLSSPQSTAGMPGADTSFDCVRIGHVQACAA